MEDDVYEEIYESAVHKDSFHQIKLNFPSISMDTIVSIFFQKCQETRKSMQTTVYTTKIDIIMHEFKEGSSLVQISNKHHLPACIVAKAVLKTYYQRLLRINELEAQEKAKVTFRDPSLIENIRLKNEVCDCILNDEVYSPLSDNIRQSIGYEYELILQDFLYNRKIEFISEKAMRDHFHKTPDVLLKAPISVNHFEKKTVINWIESKASFGNKFNHTKNQDQYYSYFTRYGPGLVIYWFGYQASLNKTLDESFIIMDHFPSNIVLLQFNDGTWNNNAQQRITKI